MAMVLSPKATLSTTLAVLRPTPGERLKRFAIIGHFTFMLLYERLGQRDQVPALER
jgi:hypothetical protein